MLAIFIRTLIVYVILITVMRLMGKRQIGELEVTDLVTTLLLSEIASLPITGTDIPLSHAVIPMITLLTLEVVSAEVLIRFPRLRALVSARPTVIIVHGKLRQRAVRDLRISLDELMSEVRQQGLTDLSQVDCAILEKNGKLTILPKAKHLPPTAEELGLSPREDALMHIVYSNGCFSKEGLRLIGKDQAWLCRKLKKRGLEPRDLFAVTANEDGEIFYIQREERE